VLTIAGSDPSGGAGIQADLKTFHQFGAYGMAAVSLLTIQNTLGVRKVHVLSPQKVKEQVQAVLDDITPLAAKTGALGSSAVIAAVGQMAARFLFPLVVDPVMVSKNGTWLMDPPACRTFIKHLLPHAYLVTPNVPEAVRISGMACKGSGSFRDMARKISGYGPRAVLIKGGHLKGEAVDYLYWQGEDHYFRAPRIKSAHSHGTGCTYSAAIAALLARGRALDKAVKEAKAYVTRALSSSPHIGHGNGPINHFAKTGL
jgi:hydroxymethylpyrimidine/phosphomethylpyrimidine kinase